MKKVFTILIFLVLLFPLWALKEGDPAPFFKIKDLEGNQWRLSRLVAREKPVVLVFFSMYCPHCREEMPFLNHMYEKYSKEGVVFLGICVNINDSVETLKAFRDSMEIKFPLAMDLEGNFISLAYNVSAVPAAFLIDKEGNIKKIKIGYSKELAPGFEREIAELLRN